METNNNVIKRKDKVKTSIEVEKTALMALSLWKLSGRCGILLEKLAFLYSTICVCVLAYRSFQINLWFWECLVVVIGLSIFCPLAMQMAGATKRCFSQWFMALDPTKASWFHDCVLVRLRAIVFNCVFLPCYVVCYFYVRHWLSVEVGGNNTIWCLKLVTNFSFWLGWCTIGQIVFFIPFFVFYWASVGSTNPHLRVLEDGSVVNASDIVREARPYKEISNNLDSAKEKKWTNLARGVWMFGENVSCILISCPMVYWPLCVCVTGYYLVDRLGDTGTVASILTLVFLFFVPPQSIRMSMAIDDRLSKWFLGLNPAMTGFNPTWAGFVHKNVQLSLVALVHHCLFFPLYVVGYYFATKVLLSGQITKNNTTIWFFRLVMYFGVGIGWCTVALVVLSVTSFCYYLASLGSSKPHFYRDNGAVVDNLDPEKGECRLHPSGAVQECSS